VLLPRRSNAWSARLQCRSKGKAVIVRIGKLNLGGFDSVAASRWSQWSRKAVSVLALLASVSALALIVESQYGGLWFGQFEARASSQDALAAADAQAGDPVTVLAPDEESRYRALSEFVARRYRVSQDAAFDLVSHAHRVGRQLQLDPLLIVAVIAIESRFNPIAESVAGAKGLMQIIPKYHGDKLEEFGGVQAVFDPETNIQVGSKILREYIRRTGNLGVALQMYAGALGDNEDQYTRKVLNERARLQQVLSPRAAERPARPVTVRTASVQNRNSLVLPPELD
jgi:soluble lytic murein transglycosylase-like protein